jgi:hypothetical protein
MDHVMKTLESNTTATAAILSRVIKPRENNLPLAAARAFLRFDFDADDRQRMHELAVKNQEDALTDDERTELDAYVQVGLFLDLLRAKARHSLRKDLSRRKNGNGR